MLHVIASEMIPKPAPTREQLAAKMQGLTLKMDLGSVDNAIYDNWKGYARDGYVGGWAQTDVPWLMIQGTFDFQTPISLAEAAREHIVDPNLQMVRVDGGGHGATFASSCTMSILDAFIADPKAKVDASCVEIVHRAALDLSVGDITYLFGTQSAWD